MEDLQYPIGKFQVEADVTPEHRRQWIEEIAATPANLCRALEGLTEAQLDTPYREGGWTVRQVVHHLADANLNSYIRFKLGLTEEQPAVKPYNEQRWSELPDARTAPPEVSLHLLEALHHRWVQQLDAMTPADFARTVKHPEAGELSLDTLLALYAWHGKHHTAQITALRTRMGW